jgi:hypothetical protein
VQSKRKVINIPPRFDCPLCGIPLRPVTRQELKADIQSVTPQELQDIESGVIPSTAKESDLVGRLQRREFALSAAQGARDWKPSAELSEWEREITPPASWLLCCDRCGHRLLWAMTTTGSVKGTCPAHIVNPAGRPGRPCSWPLRHASLTLLLSRSKPVFYPRVLAMISRKRRLQVCCLGLVSLMFSVAAFAQTARPRPSPSSSPAIGPAILLDSTGKQIGPFDWNSFQPTFSIPLGQPELSTVLLKINGEWVRVFADSSGFRR